MLKRQQLLWPLWLLGIPANAHTVSMSTSRLEVQTGKAVLELRVPEYEVRHVANPERTIPQAITIGDAGPANVRCAPADGAYVCRSEYSIVNDRPLRVTCKLAEVIVENHVHVMQANRGGRVDQAIFDANTKEAVLRFRQAGAVESAIQSRPQLVLLVLLAALAGGVLGSAATCIVFVGAVAAAGALRFITWQLPPGFTEILVAVAAAYAAFEVLFLPPGSLRVVVAGVLGGALGTYVFALIPSGTGVTAVIATIAVVSALITFAGHRAKQLRRAIAIAAFATAIAWVAFALL
jgi:hypothetical protein